MIISNDMLAQFNHIQLTNIFTQIMLFDYVLYFGCTIFFPNIIYQTNLKK